MSIRHTAAVPPPERVVIVLTTWPADRDAMVLAAPLVEERLAACVNVLPAMRSVYRWEGAVQQESELQCVIKTTLGRVPDVYARLRTLHPYEIPEFLVVDVTAGGDAYLDWVTASTKGE